MAEDQDEDRYVVERRWPPPGAHFTYDLAMEIGDHHFDLKMSVPSGPGSSIELESAMVHRVSGPTEHDTAFRDALYEVVGMIVVQAGHVEAAMKRAILYLEGTSSLLVDVDHTWTDLAKRLTQAAGQRLPGKEAKALLEALDWADARNLKDIRDHVVHGYVWEYDTAAILISRWKRKQAATRIVATFDELRRGAMRMHDFARMLETPLHGRWLEVALPEVADGSEVPPTTTIRFATPGREDQHPT